MLFCSFSVSVHLPAISLGHGGSRFSKEAQMVLSPATSTSPQELHILLLRLSPAALQRKLISAACICNLHSELITIGES